MLDQEKSGTSVKNEPAQRSAENTEIFAISDNVLDTYEVARFWSRVEVRKRDQCWPWRYGLTDTGYGDFRLTDGNTCQAHRFAYRLAKGRIAEGMVVRHSCDNRCCCNPNHLLEGTHADNVADRVSRGRSAIGEDSGRAKLTEDLVRAMRKSPLTDAYWAHRCGVDAKTIQNARDRVTWKHIP